MSKVESFSSFRPSFLSVGLGWLPKLFEEAFNNGRPEIDKQLGAASSYEYSGLVGAGWVRSIRFGHVREIDPIGDDLSGAAPYRLTVEFDGDALKQVKLTLNLLNPRVVIANDLFYPARFTNSGGPQPTCTTLTTKPEPCGFAILHEPDSLTAEERFTKLRKDINTAQLETAVPSGYLPFNKDTLVGRFDISISWKADALGKYSADLFGYSIGTPDVVIPDGLNAARLFSPAISEPFDSLVNRSVGVALELPHDLVDGILVAIGKGDGMSAKGAELYAKARRSFNLTEKFVGVLFEGIKVHVLDDTDQPIGNYVHGGIGLTAFAIDGKEEKLGNWYTTFLAEMAAVEGKPYLGMFSRLSVSAMLADRDIKQLQMKTRFVEMDAPFSWLNGRDAVISVGLDKWKDRLGKDMEGRWLGLSLESASAGDVLKRLNAQALGLSEDAFGALATTMTLAPIVFVEAPPAAEQDNTATETKRRGYFTAIREGQTIAQLFVAYTMGWFFKEAIEVEEIRVLGIGLQVQPKQVSDPTSGPDERETALLLDYETDFKVKLKTPSLETERTVTARVDGTGIRVAGGALAWVQVPRGLHDLQLADPGLWKLGSLGKILKVVELSIRRDPVKQLAIRLHLTGDLGILTASDFVFTVDLTSGSADIESFPSEVRIEKADVFKATGKLFIDTVEQVEDIRGSLDVALTAMGWRGYAALRITQIDDGKGGKAKASIGSMRLEWPTMVPVLSTGIGVKSLEGLLATHFERSVPTATPAVPADLAWLEQADGSVVTSIEKKELWKAKFGASTVGFGLGLGLMTNPKIANFNAMFAVEEPGHQLLMFAKLNLLKDPKPNDKEPESLGKGVLGLIKVDQEKSELIFAALADIEFSSMAHIRAPIEIAANWKQLSAWHVFIGHFDDPITATLKIENIAALTAQAWLMAAGDQINDAPVGPGSRRTLPGLALSLGYRVHAQIGPDFLCVRGNLATYINASFSKAFFASGAFVIGGELRLFIVSIGAGGSFEAQYLKSNDPDYSALYAAGEICGRYENFFFSISGCVRLSLGSQIVDPTSPPPLVQGVRLVAGASVALFGQGQTGQIDAILGDAKEHPSQSATGIPLDAVVTVDLEAPPRVASGGGGFLAKLTRPYENMRFHLGAREGHYLLKQVSLEREVSAGNWQGVDYSKSPASWWHPHRPPSGDQPVPTTLALLTRAPLSTPNAMPDPEQLEKWIEALIADDICDSSLGPQRCCYMLTKRDRGAPTDGKWILRAELPSKEIELRIGRAGATDSPLLVEQRELAGTPGDQLPGYPPYPATCKVVADASAKTEVAFLELKAHLVRNTWVFGTVTLGGPILSADPLLIVLAQLTSDAEFGATIIVKTRTGKTFYARLADHSSGDLAVAGTLERFHEGSERWKKQAEDFAALASTAQYAGYHFELIEIDFLAMGVDRSDVVESVQIRLANDVGSELGYRLAITLLVGAYRFTPHAEKQRSEHDEATRVGTINDLNDYLKGERVPLLEPDSSYRVIVDYDTITDHNVTKSDVFHFRTSDKPPKSADAYLLGTFPQDREASHFPTEAPGFCLATADALRILSKFSDARLKISIIEDNGAPVLSDNGALQWHLGLHFDPKDIFPDDPTQGFPDGLLPASVASLPTALREALARHINKNGLGDCLGPIQLPPGSLWIGFDVVLRPLSSYRIVVELLGDENIPYHPDAPPFLSWQFKTGLSPTIAAYADMLRGGRIRHRSLVRPMPDLPVIDEQENVVQIADKILEDHLALVVGERILVGAEASLTVLWEHQNDYMVAVAVVLESTEPLMRRTRGVRIEEKLSGDGRPGIRIAVPASLVFVAPSLSHSKRVSRIEVATSGRVLIARLKDEPGDVGIAIERRSIERFNSGTPVVEIINIAAGALANRPIPE